MLNVSGDGASHFLPMVHRLTAPPSLATRTSPRTWGLKEGSRRWWSVLQRKLAEWRALTWRSHSSQPLWFGPPAADEARQRHWASRLRSGNLSARQHNLRHTETFKDGPDLEQTLRPVLDSYSAGAGSCGWSAWWELPAESCEGLYCWAPCRAAAAPPAGSLRYCTKKQNQQDPQHNTRTGPCLLTRRILRRSRPGPPG